MQIGLLTRLSCIACLLCPTTSPGAAYAQNPLLVDGEVYVSRQGVYRFDPTRGAPLWSSLVGVETYAPVLLDSQLLVGSTQGLYALDRASGRVNWRIESSRSVFSPAVAKRAYAGSVHGELYAIDPIDGSITWRRQFPGWIYSPALDPDSGLAWSGGQMHEVYSLQLDDGALRDTLPTTQETVFSPLDLGDGRAVFNLFDGSSMVIDMRGRAPPARLAGDAQPTGLLGDPESIYRSHRDGSLVAFSRVDLSRQWWRQVTARDLALHPAMPGYLLLSDLDRRLVLLDLAEPGGRCETVLTGRWSLPFQLSAGKIAYFRKTMQPPRFTLVKTRVHCN